MRLPTAGSPDKIDEAAATRLLHEAIEKGVNYVDTA
jgi:predicted aldo/keto reductase-like oxidoreductase